jgi:Glycosyltransferase family 87
MRRALVVVAAVVALLGVSDVSARAAVIVDPVAPVYGTKVPPGNGHLPFFRMTSNQAVAIAERTDAVHRLRARYGRALGRATFALSDPSTWSIVYSPPGSHIPNAEVLIDDLTGHVRDVWTGIKASWAMARGSKGGWAREMNAPYIFIPLCAVFLLAFFDFRRPLRLLHFDLLALLSFAASQYFFQKGHIYVSVPLQYVPLAYLLVRMLVAGFRPRRGSGPLIPHLPMRAVVALAIVLFAVRIALNVGAGVIDVGYASVVGADRIQHGQQLYVDNSVHGDTYGPLTYAAYVPFEKIWPYTGHWDALPAAHAAAIFFDALIVVALVLLALRLRPGPEGRRLAAGLALAWLAYPYTSFALMANTNDAIVGATLALVLLVNARPAARGAMLAASAATKFAPLALVPLFATVRTRSARAWLAYAVAFAAIAAIAVLAFLPAGGLREFWNTTIGFQLGRQSPFSLWGQYASLHWLQTLLKVGAVALACVVAFVPRERSTTQLAALGAAVLIAFQLPVTHWFYLYIVWFAPYVLLALFAEHRTVPTRVPAAPSYAAREPAREAVAAA